MARSEWGPVLRHIRTLAGQPAAAALTDGQLLRAFAGRHDEAAFAALVQRHGPLVLSVCRRVLRQEQDAEDAFQATFLVLARKAASIRQGHSLANWLYGVAHRTALRLRTAASRRALAGMPPPVPPPDPTAEASLRELQQLLDEEVTRLPEKYRAPFVLCCLEGHSRSEAAQQLGWNEGTLSGRLALARHRLRQRLARRGVSLTAVLAAVALGPAANAGVPVALAGVTVEAAARLSAGQAVGAGSAQAIALGETAVRAMSRTRINIAAVLLFLTLAGVGAGVHALRAPGGKPDEADRPQAERPPAPDRPRSDRSGDPLPPGVIARLGTVRFRTWADRVAFLPGDKVLATIGREAVSFWDAGTGKETRRSVDMRWGEASALSADGKLLAVSAIPNDSTIHLWEVETGKHVRQFKGFEGRTRALVFTADGRTLVSGGLDNKVRVWDTSTGKEVRQMEVGHPVEGLAISPDGKTLASAGWDVASTVSVRETDTGKELHRYRLPLGVGHVAFAPDGKALAALEDWNDDGGARENKVHLWDVSTGKLRRQLTLREHILCLAFSPDSKALATGHLDTLHVWDVDTGKWLERFEGHSGRTDLVAFSGDGKTLATGGNSTLRLWDVFTGKEVPALGEGHQGAVHALAFLGDGKTLVTGGEDHTLRHWEVATGKEVRRFPGVGGGVFSPSFAPDKILALPTEQEVRLCDPVTGKELRRLRFSAHVRQVALTPDGKGLAVYAGGKDLTLRLVDTDTGKERWARRYQDQEFVQAMALSPGGELLALGPVGPVLRLLDTATGGEAYQLRLTENVTNLTFSPDGKTLAGGAGCGTLHFWEVATGKQRAAWPDRDLRSGSTMAFSPDGRVLALGDSDGALRLCLAGTGKELRRLPGHQNGITCLAFSADGKMLASGSWDTTVLVWDVSALLDRKAEQGRELGAGQLDALWANLAGDDAVAAYQAIQKLAAVPRQAVPLLKARLRPVARVGPKQIASLLADLDSDAFEAREESTAELEKLGEAAGPAVRKALEGKPSPEARRRLEGLLHKLRRVSPERLRELRALEALERIDSPEVRQTLEALAGGMPEARLTQEAKAALRRLVERSGLP
jgi:RNA polymerase sigma factor (sigma-70 family)